MRATSTVLFLSLTVVLVGCKGGAPLASSKPRMLGVEVVASPDLNPNQAGRASPVLLHIYQLRDDGKFLNSDFEAVTTRSASALGGDLVGLQELMVEPGTTTPLHIEIGPRTRVLGVVAEYEDLAASRWRATDAIPAQGVLSVFKHTRLIVHLDSRAVSITSVTKEGL